MAFDADMPLAELAFVSAEQLAQLHLLAIDTLGELLGATLGLQRYPGDPPDRWEALYTELRALVGTDLLRACQTNPLPPMGLRSEHDSA